MKSSTSERLFIYTGNRIRREVLCPITMETQTLCLCIYSGTKHSRLIVDVADELKWLETLKQTIKCTLGKPKRKTMMQERTVFLIFKHICMFKLKEMSMLLLFLICH